MHLAALVDRDIFAGYETFIGEVKSGLVRYIGAAAVMERPAAALTMDEMTNIVLPVRPPARDPACFPMLSPECRIDPVVRTEGRDDDIGDASVAFGMAGLACKFDVNLAALRRQGSVQDRFWTRVLHLGLTLQFRA